MWDKYSTFMNDLPEWVTLLVWLVVGSAILISFCQVGVALWIKGRDVTNVVDASKTIDVKKVNKKTRQFKTPI
jgi:hypothetical protein